MPWMRLLYKLTRKIFWFQSNFIPFLVQRGKKGKIVGGGVSRGGPVASSHPIHLLKGLDWVERSAPGKVFGGQGDVLPHGPTPPAAPPGCDPRAYQDP